MESFPQFLVRKFREWEISTKRKQSVSSFARYLGVKQPSLSRWMTGDNPPDLEHIQKLAAKLGPEIYEILGFEKPEHAVKEWQALYDLAPPDLRDELLEMNRQWLKKKGLK